MFHTDGIKQRHNIDYNIYLSMALGSKLKTDAVLNDVASESERDLYAFSHIQN